MKSLFKKTLSAILCLSLLVGTIFVTSVSADEAAPGTDIPTIYVMGQGLGLCTTDENGNERYVYPISLPEGFIEETVKENIGVFAKAFFTQRWGEFCDVLYEVFVPLFDEFKLDENGNSKENIYPDWSWSKEALNPNKVNGKYPTDRFCFHYDWRLDPYEIADILHSYIEDVLEVTGETEVALVGRCLGACITSAYMEKYDCEYVAEYILYCSAFNGSTPCSQAFSGDLLLHSDGIENFIYDLALFDDETITELLKAFVTLFNKTYGLDITCAAVNNVFNNIYLDIVPRVLIDTFATFPGFWSMVSARDYQKAKDTVFYGADLDKYENLIKKIDDYHYNVQVKAPENFREYVERGIEVSNITKYGYQCVPVAKETEMLSDGLCSVFDASMGATTSDTETTLSEEYLYSAEQKGTSKYISPDKQIDASTCLFPDTTWFIKDVKHKVFPDSIHLLFDAIINNDNFTVNSDENYPQYMVFEEETGNIVPMTEDNCKTDDRYFVSFFDAFIKFFKYLFEVIKNLINSKA